MYTIPMHAEYTLKTLTNSQEYWFHQFLFVLIIDPIYVIVVQIMCKICRNILLRLPPFEQESFIAMVMVV